MLTLKMLYSVHSTLFDPVLLSDPWLVRTLHVFLSSLDNPPFVNMSVCVSKLYVVAMTVSVLWV
jgi:hypothetical protein